MGITEIFTPGAGFSPMSGEWLKMDQIVHKAKIEVNRKSESVITETFYNRTFNLLWFWYNRKECDYSEVDL